MEDKVKKCHASKHCAKNNLYVALVLILRLVRSQKKCKNAASSKTQKSDGSEWRVIILLQMVYNKNQNITELIDGSQGFARCAQISLATKNGGATANQKLWVK